MPRLFNFRNGTRSALHWMRQLGCATKTDRLAIKPTMTEPRNKGPLSSCVAAILFAAATVVACDDEPGFQGGGPSAATTSSVAVSQTTGSRQRKPICNRRFYYRMSEEADVSYCAHLLDRCMDANGSIRDGCS